MGCDIHMYIEHKVGDGEWMPDPNHIPRTCEDEVGKWLCCARDYALFGMLARVRCNFDQSRDPRGLPNDVSSLVKKASDVYGIDGHSHSWVSLEEFREILEDYNNIPGTGRDQRADINTDDTDCWDWDKPYENIIAYCKDIKEEAEAVYRHILEDDNYRMQSRLVFWFDN